MKRLAEKAISLLGRSLNRLGALRPWIFIEMDGGICSQMHFYMVGRMLEARGAEVVYELKWFDECGRDMDGRFERNFDLTKLFPNLPVRVSGSRLRSLLYRKSFPRALDWFDRGADHLMWLDTRGPAYFLGYFHDTEELYGPLFRETFSIDPSVLDAANRRVLSEIESAPASCAVHVRRGDLAVYSEVYGSPATPGYFLEAVRAVREADDRGIRFFIFSDEPDWVRKSLLPLLAAEDVTVCDINGSDRGWCDLALMSRCRHHITSQGSLGKYAALLRPGPQRGGLVTLPPQSAEWQPRFMNTKIISL